MTQPATQPAAPPQPTAATSADRRKRFLLYGLLGAGGLALILLVTVLITAWWVKRQFDPAPIEPTQLTQVEEKVLADKIEVLSETRTSGQLESTQERPSVSITEKELNALLAKNTGLGDKVRIELGRDTIAARTNILVPDDFPILGGKTVRLKVALVTTIEDTHLVMRVADVSLGGFPLPNAWLGGIKGVDLVSQYAQGGPLHAFVAGIDELQIGSGKITLYPAD